MFVSIMNPKCRNLMSFGIHAIRVTFADAILCAVSGALFGMVWGGFCAQARHDQTAIYTSTGIYAFVGFLIGATVGALRELSLLRELRRRHSERAARAVAKSTNPQQSRLPATTVMKASQNTMTASRVRLRHTAIGS